MSATDYINFCYDAFIKLDYNTRLYVVLSLFFCILIFSWIDYAITWSICTMIRRIKMRGNNNA